MIPSNYKIWLLILLGGFLSGQLQAQSKWLIKAERLLEEKEYQKAIEYFEWAEKDGADPQIWLGIGKAHRAMRDFSQAAEFFHRAAKMETAPPEAAFLLGQCLMSQEMPDSAAFWFRQYSQRVGADASQFSESAFEDIVSATPFDTAEFEFFKLPFNSKYSDFSPVLSGQDLYFCSNRPSETGVVRKASGDGSYLVDIYRVEGFAELTRKKLRVRPFQALNSRLNEGPLCFTGDGETVFLTRNQPSQDKFRQNTLNRLEIKILQRNGDNWGPGPSLPVNSPDYAVAHPCFVEINGRKGLYFSSDKPGGYGGSDLYYMEMRSNGDFGPPSNLGPNINTPGDELFPFVHTDGDLYFSSDGRIGRGGLDVYRAVQNAEGWGTPRLLDQPINSPADDFGYRIDEAGENGFFCSNRNNKAQDDDIYAFRMKLPRFESCSIQEENNYCYRFTEESLFEEEDDSVAIAYVWNLGDGTQRKGLTVEHCYEKPGDYLVELNLMDTISNLRLLTQSAYPLEIRAIEQLYIWAPESIAVGQPVELHGRDSNFPDCLPEKYYWEIDGVPSGKGAAIEVDFDQPGTYTIRMGVVGEKPDECKACVTREINVK